MASSHRKQRDWRFEFLRLFAMLLIVATHFFANDNWRIHRAPSEAASWEASLHESLSLLGQVGVTLFVLISAYFMTRSASHIVLRLVKLWIQVFIYSVVALLIGLWAFHASVLPRPATGYDWAHIVVSALFPVIFGEYWFISAFFIMMALVPFMNRLLDALDRKETLRLTSVMVVIVFIWKFANPQSSTFTDFGYLCTIYLIGSIIRRYPEVLPRMTLPRLLGVFVLGFGACAAGTYAIRQGGVVNDFMRYPANLFTAGTGASPILAVLMGAALFVYVAQGKAPAKTGFVATVTLTLSPATLGIYLLHENPILKQIIWSMVFSGPEPQGLAGKAAQALLAIAAVYLGSLVCSGLIHFLVVNPVQRLVPGRGAGATRGREQSDIQRHHADKGE